MERGTCHIIAGGPQGALSFERHEGDLVIAADGGYRLCMRAGIVPDVLIGDYDSLGSSAAAAAHVPERITLPVAKDDTDTMAAIRMALARGYRRIEVHAALGGDVGHELANIQSLLFVRRHGAWGCLHGGGQDVYVVVPGDGIVRLEVGAGTRVSVFSLDGTAEGVCERGLVWELEDAVLEADFPLGVSNEAACDEVAFGVAAGALAIVVGSAAPF